MKLRAKSMNRNNLERCTLEGDSPVDEIDMSVFERVEHLGLGV